METKSAWAPGPGVRVLGAERDGNRWMISVIGPQVGSCPGCGVRSKRWHSHYSRRLQDLPAQGTIVTVKLQMTRWRCLNEECERQTFSEQLSGVAARYARRTLRIGQLVQLFGHVVGGRPGERLMKRLGMPTSDDTILRHLKRSVKGRVERTFACWALTIGAGARALATER